MSDLHGVAEPDSYRTNDATMAAAFVSPPTSARPLLRWWWPGGAVSAEAVCAQLSGFHEAGWGGVEIQTFRAGLPHQLPAEAAALVHEVFTPRWFQTVSKVMEEAQSLGMLVDITFGSCWPFGGGDAVTPELATQELSLAWTSVQGPGLWRGKPNLPQRPQRFGTRMERDGAVDPAQQLPPGWRERMAALEQTVAVLALRGAPPELGPFPGFVPLTLPDIWGQVHAAGQVRAEETIDLSECLAPDGTLQWQVPPGQWQIVVVRRFVSDQRITEAAGRGPQLVIDHLKREAFDVHAARVGDAALPHWQQHAGRSWRSIFIDSLELPTDLLWTDDFESEFLRRRGYALKPFLPLLLQPGWRNCFQPRNGAPLFDDPQAGPRVRADYRLTVSELMIERCYAPLSQWAESHGLMAKVQAHGAPVDWLQAYGCGHLPETEDLAGGAAPHFLRVARSAAHLHGRRLVTAEAFCWLLEGLAVTPQQLRERADEFFAAGIQQLIGHGASAPLMNEGAEGAALPHWYPFEAMEIGTQLDAANPLWPMLRPVADYIARCQLVMQQGRAVVPVAVLAPLDLFAFNGAAERLTPPAWHAALQAEGYDWDWINGDALLASRLQHGALVTAGGHVYRALLIPDLPALRVEVAERLAACADAGLAVWAMGEAPRREEGWLGAEERDARVQAAMAVALNAGRRLVAPSTIGKALRKHGVTPCVALAADGEAALQGWQFHVRESDDGNRWLFLHNPRSAPAALELAVPVEQGAELWHGWTGRRERLSVDDAGAVKLSVPARGARILRFACVSACVEAVLRRPRRLGAIEITLSGPWSVLARGRGLQGRAIAFQAQWADLQDLSQLPEYADFAGEIEYGCDIQLSENDLAAGPLWLDLGRVCDAAQVQLNGSAVATAPEAPFVIDISSALRTGTNQLRITVANRPENASRDPARPGGIPLPGRRLSRLPTSLLGPVRLITATAPATRWRLA